MCCGMVVNKSSTVYIVKNVGRFMRAQSEMLLCLCVCDECFFVVLFKWKINDKTVCARIKNCKVCV